MARLFAAARLFRAMMDAGLKDFRESWRKSIYEQAAEASAEVLAKKRRETAG